MTCKNNKCSAIPDIDETPKERPEWAWLTEK